MFFSKRNKFVLFCLLILLNFIIRIPSYPHERGSPDEFTMHNLANSLTTFGSAQWWTHWSSIFGFYPYSYASSAPFIFSGVSQMTGITMDKVAWILPAIVGTFVVFSAYLLAGLIIKDDIFKFLLAFSLSISQGILNYTTWQISARGFFVLLLPFFLYLLLKSRTFPVRFGVLTFFFAILLMATHHYYIFTIIFTLAFIVILISYRLKFIKFPVYLIQIALFAGLITAFLIPFFTGLFIQGSRYNALQYILENNVRYSGLLIFLAFGGLIYLILKPQREFGEKVLLLSLIFFAPFFYIDKYAQFISTLLINILICIGILNAIKAFKGNMKYISIILLITFIISASFSTFYQTTRTSNQRIADKWYMEDTTYYSALWIKDNIQNKRLTGNSDHTSTRVLSVSEVPTLVVGETDLAYGFVDSTILNTSLITMNSPFSTEFYMNNPFILPTRYYETDTSRWQLQVYSIENSNANKIISRFNLSYYLENANSEIYEFIESLDEKKEKLYDNGRIIVWCLDCSK